jgi:hypothetical protein
MDLSALEGWTLPATKDSQGTPRNLSSKPTKNGLQAGGTSEPPQEADIISSQVQRWRKPSDLLEPSLLSLRTGFLCSQAHDQARPSSVDAVELAARQHIVEAGEWTILPRISSPTISASNGGHNGSQPWLSSCRQSPTTVIQRC